MESVLGAFYINNKKVKRLDISIVIVSYGTKRLTLECIESVKKHTKGVNYEVVVVDNASEDGSAEALAKVGGGVTVIKNKENLGFAKANNQGASHAKGKYILLLNSDTKLTSDVISKAVGYLESHKETAIYSCKLKSIDGSTQRNGGYFPTLVRIFSWMYFLDDLPFLSYILTSYHPPVNFYSKSHYLDWVTAAFCMVRRGNWEEVRGMSPEYFMYVEDVDLCYKVRGSGAKVYYDASTSITHYGGASSDINFTRVNEFVGLRTFYKKHFRVVQGSFLRFFLKTGALLRMIIFGVTKGSAAYTIYKNAYEVA